MKAFLVAPSILSADFAHMAREIKSVEEAGADWLHVDVMDGHFVPNLTIGAPVVRSLRSHSPMIFDVHLMIENPEKYIPDFIAAGSDYITIHVEATKNVHAALDMIQAGGKKAGITLRPETPIGEIFPYLKKVDLVLIMTVSPGFGGQAFMKEQVLKIHQVREELARLRHTALIEVDGGINPETAVLCHEADVLVAGNYIFKNDYKTAIRKLKMAKGQS